MLLGKLQVECVGHTEELKEAGVPCESSKSLIPGTKAMLDDNEIRKSLLQFEEFLSTTGAGERRLNKHVQALREFMEKVHDDGRYPLSVVHRDMHEESIVRTREVAAGKSYVLCNWGFSTRSTYHECGTRQI
ncbi:hypothetical protein BWQ96_03646 [Gracilariopsis chorda]|uniref:Uncharacterized protein n=1 Tax=Gracilariopsis chorda TaxID=448386 RepID=A0A2V3IY98_9FLOR|nr:hypothetical protein BWQ96_03646 [Gracilariopsis chorda]|eukprot:PXF46657.1 hypothetical protein BWQ96_03646 [Gracilariopsis chorda]